MLIDAFKRADQRAFDLAANADQARARGVTCEQAYISLEEKLVGWWLISIIEVLLFQWAPDIRDP
ncbi:hypothetical protein ACCD00_01465 [Pseudomonas sp. Pseusp3]|uniref:hypothetical protein n=1 Tax=Pseudomonas sp. Pseusp3 TaxID=3243029 RepID=UPI0039AFEA3B